MASDDPKIAALVVKAADTGRVLMVQRSLKHPEKHAAGRWEWPAGHVEDEDDKPRDAAEREWQEETGSPLPDGDDVGKFKVDDGVYVAFVRVIAHEADVKIGAPDHDEVDAIAWWDPALIPGNPAIRIEVQSSDWALIGKAKPEDEDDSATRRRLPPHLARRALAPPASLPDVSLHGEQMCCKDGLTADAHRHETSDGRCCTDVPPTEDTRAAHEHLHERDGSPDRPLSTDGRDVVGG